jgi:hypothetical protein
MHAPTCFQNVLAYFAMTGNTKGGSITLLLTSSCFTGLD